MVAPAHDPAPNLAHSPAQSAFHNAALLPLNRTPLESALANAASRAACDALADLPGSARHQPSPAFVPWLAAEWRLAPFARYFSDPRALLAQGLPWLRQRGSAAAVTRALSWIGLDAVVEDGDARLQLDPGTVQAPSRLADVRQLVEASAPAHVRLYRLYHGYDLRRMALSGAAAMDAGMLSDDSGVWSDGVKLSFGDVRGCGIDAGKGRKLVLGRSDIRMDRLYAEQQPRLSVSPYDMPPALNHRIQAGQLITLSNRHALANPDSIARRRNVRRANIALSDSDEIGAINAVFQRDYWHQPPDFMTLSGNTRLSAYDGRIERRPVDEIRTLFAASMSFSDVGGAVASFGITELRSIGAIDTGQPAVQPKVGVEFVRGKHSRFDPVFNPAPAMWAYAGGGAWNQDAVTGWPDATPWGAGVRQR